MSLAESLKAAQAARHSEATRKDVAEAPETEAAAQAQIAGVLGANRESMEALSGPTKAGKTAKAPKAQKSAPKAPVAPASAAPAPAPVAGGLVITPAAKVSTESFSHRIDGRRVEAFNAFVGLIGAHRPGTTHRRVLESLLEQLEGDTALQQRVINGL